MTASAFARTSSGFTIIGHRGARGHAPENTLAGLEAGIRLGADALEFDVQLHSSGHLFLLHDLRLERTTNGRGRAADCSWDELRRLDAGTGERIPTLTEALDCINRRVAVNIELKTWNGTAAAVAEVLRGFLAKGWHAEDFLVSSFHLPELREFRQRLPEIPLGALYAGLPLHGFKDALELGAEYVNLSSEFADAAIVAGARERGLKVMIYTVNEPDEMLRWKREGASGVFTDDPQAARKAFSR